MSMWACEVCERDFPQEYRGITKNSCEGHPIPETICMGCQILMMVKEEFGLEDMMEARYHYHTLDQEKRNEYYARHKENRLKLIQDNGLYPRSRDFY